jgi:hypothetical protein
MMVVAILTLCLFAPQWPAASAQQTVTRSGVRISQIYTRGGEAGAPYQNDFIELFNSSSTTVDINGWTFVITTSEGSLTTSSAVGIVSTRGIGVEPGKHLLIQLAAGGAAGQPLPSPDFSVPPMRLGSTSGQVALLNKNQTVQFGQCLANDTTGVVEDFVGYGTTTCFEGQHPTPAPTLANAILRQGGGCTDTNDNEADFQYAAPNPRNGTNAAAPCGAQAVQSIIDVGAPQFDAFEGQGHIDITLTRIGDLSTAVSAEYLVAGGTASERSDFTTAAGYVHFAPGEREKTVPVLITDDAVEEPTESTSIAILNPSTGAAIGVRNQALLVIHDNDFGPAASNPIDESGFYARQHYADFLSREPDMSGLDFWSAGVDSCGADALCREVKRIDTSAAFFLSIEFQETGYLVYRLYKASLPENRVRPRALPRYREFMRDTQEVSRGIVVGETGWEQKLADNTNAFLNMFVARPEFTLIYPAQLSPAAYVDRLNAQSGGPLSPAERDALVAGMLSGEETRASVLRRVADDEDFRHAEFNRAFVLMQYFGYLRRNPDEAPDTNFDGYDFWLSKLEQFGGDYRRAEMVKAFVSSPEYRNRFAATAQ